MKWYFFKALREKRDILNRCKRGDVVPLLKYIIYRARLSHFFYIQRKHYTMRVHYSPYAFWLWTHKEKEKDEELFLESFLKKGDVVIDCGAHIGTLTLTAALCVGDKGAVIACEAHPRTFLYLLRSVSDSPYTTIACHNVAVGDDKKEALFSDYYANDLNGVDTEGALTVTMTTLDEIASSCRTIDLLKLDIEGSELDALHFGKEALRKTKAIYFESAPRSFARFGYELKDIISFLDEQGFVCYITKGATIGERIDVSHVTTVRYENILALRA